MNEVAAFIGVFCGLYKQHRKATYFVRRPKDLTLARLLLDTYGADELRVMAEDLLTTQDDWIAGTDRGIGILVTKASWLSNRLAQRSQAPMENWWDECQRVHGKTCINGYSHGTRMLAERREEAS